MRILTNLLVLLVVFAVSACDFWPRDLKPLAETISRQVSGETMAWLVAGDVVVINVANSPLYRKGQSELESLATGIAEQTIVHIAAPLESIAITFHEGEVSEDAEKMREFIFLVMDNRPVLQPYVDVDATGPLTAEEVQAAIARLGDSLNGEQLECIREEVMKRAQTAGDPETLDPATVEFLTAETWRILDAFGKRLILAQAITSEAAFACAGA
jgi:hypothetical protein